MIRQELDGDHLRCELSSWLLLSERALRKAVGYEGYGVAYGPKSLLRPQLRELMRAAIRNR